MSTQCLGQLNQWCCSDPPWRPTNLMLFHLFKPAAGSTNEKKLLHVPEDLRNDWHNISKESEKSPNSFTLLCSAQTRDLAGFLIRPLKMDLHAVRPDHTHFRGKVEDDESLKAPRWQQLLGFVAKLHYQLGMMRNGLRGCL